MDIRATIVRQYRAPSAMLRKTIEACPEDLWLSGEPNRFWHVAYHVAFYTDLYLSPTEADFRFRPFHRLSSQFLSPDMWDPNEPPVLEHPYTQEEVLEYVEYCVEQAGSRTASVELEAPSGFYWLPIDKLELQFDNVRHLQHHTAQLIERVRQHTGKGIGWVR